MYLSITYQSLTLTFSLTLSVSVTLSLSLFIYIYLCVCVSVRAYVYVCAVTYLYIVICVTICPLANLHYLNILHRLVAIRSSRGFSHLWPEAFHLFYKHTTDTTYIIESGRKKNKLARTWVSSNPKNGEALALFCVFLCTNGYRQRVSKKNSHTATRNADSSSGVG